MKRKFLSLAALLLALFSLPYGGIIPAFADSAPADTVQSRKTPIMGWASWNAYRTDISEEIILSQGKKLVELGLAELGYTFLNVDDGWQDGRGSDGYVRVNTEKFPNGMKYIADTAHKMGLQAGIYTDAGASTCGWESDKQTSNDDVGLYGHDEGDLRRYFIDWGYDFIKVDWCGGRQLGLSQKDRYTAIGDVVKRIERETGKDKIYNVCCWAFPGEWVVDVADSWRTGGDIYNNFPAVLAQLDNIKSLAGYNGPGHVNDLDMMQVGNHLSYEEDKSHFSMWCMMSTPLMLGMDLNSISEETLSIISNAEVIALDQDPACIQATVAKTIGQVEIWTKDLGYAGSGRKAIAILNRGSKESRITVPFDSIGLDGVEAVRDLWSHTDISVNGSYTVTVPAHGTVLLTAEGKNVALTPDDTLFKDDGSVVTAAMSAQSKPSKMDLSALGDYDWKYFGGEGDAKKDGAGEITLRGDGIGGGYDNAACAYSWSDGETTQRAVSKKSGQGAYGVGSYFLLTTPCDQNERTLRVPVGSYSADMTVELIVGGKRVKSITVKGAGDTKKDQLITCTYHSDIPTTAVLYWYVTKDLGNSESVNAEAAALSITVSTDTLSREQTEVGADGVSVTAYAAAVSDAACVFAMKDRGGILRELQVVPVAAGKPGKVGCVFHPDAGFSGTVEVYLWRALVPCCEPLSLAFNAAQSADYSVGPITAKALLAEGAVLLDVRTAEEYEAGHPDGALHMEYTALAENASDILPDKGTPVIVYCSAAKRSAQAVTTLLSLGYGSVYNLGSIGNFYAEPMITFGADCCPVITAGDRLTVNFTASRYDTPEIYISAGKDSTLADAIPLTDFTVPAVSDYYLTLKAYLTFRGVCYAQCEKEFLYWSEDTALAFATDLEWSTATTGWGEIGRDHSVDDHPLRLAGKSFSRGIGTHCDSTITMKIPKGATKFLAVGGCDEEMSGDWTMMLFVYADGKMLDHSSLIKCGQSYIFDVDLPADAVELKLYAYMGTYGDNTCDHADWAVAAFFGETRRN